MDNKSVQKGGGKKELVVIDDLTSRQIKFVTNYIEGMSAVKAYAKAYNRDLETSYMTCAANASRLLKKDKIKGEITNRLTLAGFTDEGADKQLNYLMQQYEDKKVKLQAIKEYNNLKNRTAKQAPVIKGNTFNLTQLLTQAETEIKQV